MLLFSNPNRSNPELWKNSGSNRIYNFWLTLMKTTICHSLNQLYRKRKMPIRKISIRLLQTVCNCLSKSKILPFLWKANLSLFKLWTSLKMFISSQEIDLFKFIGVKTLWRNRRYFILSLIARQVKCWKRLKIGRFTMLWFFRKKNWVKENLFCFSNKFAFLSL